MVIPLIPPTFPLRAESNLMNTTVVDPKAIAVEQGEETKTDFFMSLKFATRQILDLDLDFEKKDKERGREVAFIVALAEGGWGGVGGGRSPYQ